MKTILTKGIATLILLAATAAAASADLDTDLLVIQQEWAKINYETPKKQKEDAFEALAKQTESFHKQYPDRAEPLIWKGIVLGSYAGAKGGLGALSLAKKARESLEAAEKIDPKALDGSVYTSLGSLYYKVPGWPIGFGNQDKARRYLEKAVTLNPDGIDPNFFYGEFLLKQGESEKAVEVLERALKAPARPGRELADKGRRAEVEALLTRARAEN